MELLERIETFLAETHLPETKFGRHALGDPRFVADLRAGRHPRPATEDRVLAFLGARDRAIALARTDGRRRKRSVG